MLQFGNPVRHRAGPGPAPQGAVHPAGGVFRQARARLRRAVGGAGAGRPEAARGRRLRPLPDRRPAARSASRSAARRRSAAGWSRSSSPACAACWARRRCSRCCRSDRTQLMNRIKTRGQQVAGRVRRRAGGRAHQARRPAAGEQPGDLPADADRARSARPRSCARRVPRSAQRIRARADRERRVLIAEAEREARDPARPGRRRGDPDLRRGVRPGSRVLRLLPLAAGLPRMRWATAPPASCCRRTASSSASSTAAPVGRRRRRAGPRRRRLRRRQRASPAAPPAPRPRRPEAGRGPARRLGSMVRSRHGAGAGPRGRGRPLGAVPRGHEAGGGASRHARRQAAAPGRAGLRRAWACCWSGCIRR